MSSTASEASATGERAVAGGESAAGAASGGPRPLVPGSEAWLESIPPLATAGRSLAVSLISLQTATARAAGIRPTDVAIIAHLQRVPGEPARTPGDLARLTGLTTGAITGVLDRLERDGYVRRVRDQHDRRKIFVELTGKDIETFNAVFGPMIAGLNRLCSTFSKQQLEDITRYIAGCHEVIQHAVEGMQDAA
ncbi:MarR family winged helix-turn-helix transcriptional regulator [Actinocrinis sp.]|uniref:MarR family winged helix-turn-helix transcriptional regulator n=1 Tax=Actinocrinis sp. TaxID=1920516 RepID=UPI002D6B38A5|nr:MarR family transcriptional regulator [Actinocrinis sp.]HZP51741.1 MarR family transcriptional regulator [Actinocrinis sp.]